jgi:dTMP kinase
MPLIVLEGIDGCGKSTQVERLAERLAAAGHPPLRLREPGGTKLGEQVRALLLDKATEACPTAELFGYLTARAQLCHAVIRPALARGEVVLLDRFWYSTMAYQAYGLGLDPQLVRSAIALALDGVRADVAAWLSVAPVEALRRRAAARGEDRIEARGLIYQERVHAGYAALAAAGELTVIDAARSPDAIFTDLWTLIAPLLPSPR